MENTVLNASVILDALDIVNLPVEVPSVFFYKNNTDKVSTLR